MKRPRRRFTREFKAEIFRLILDGGRSVLEVSRDHDLGETSVYHWVKQAPVDRGQGARGALTTDERAEMVRLRRENRELKREPEFFRTSDGILREGKAMKFAFIAAKRGDFPVAW